MPLTIKCSYMSNSATAIPLLGCVFMIVQLFCAQTAKALEVLTAQELSSHCELLNSEPDGADAQYCIRYIQGFIDGAIATDANVMLSAESALDDTETFTERAMRTRLPNRADRVRAAGLAGFCLGDPLPLKDVVNLVVADLALLNSSEPQDEPAMDVVYNSLQKNYPCNS